MKMSTVLNNVSVVVFTECRIASKSGAISISTKKNIPFPEYGIKNNFAFQGGGKLQYILEARKTTHKI
jgi:hypothetical protein